MADEQQPKKGKVKTFYERYDPHWHTVIRPRILKRATNAAGQIQCEQCGVVHMTINPRTGKKYVITVAHLNHDTKDNRDENLKALCRSCHMKHDSERHAETLAQIHEDNARLDIWTGFETMDIPIIDDESE